MKLVDPKQNITPSSFLTQCNLSSVLHSICMQHHSSLKKDNPNVPDLPHFVSESIHSICSDLAKIVNNNSINTDYWNSIQNTSSLVSTVINNYSKTAGEKNEES